VTERPPPSAPQPGNTLAPRDITDGQTIHPKPFYDLHLGVVEPGKKVTDAEMDPSLGFFICPWNRSDQGPAKQVVRCAVYRTADERDAHNGGGDTFCKGVCSYGRVTQAQLRKHQESVDGFLLRRRRALSWLRRQASMRKGLGILAQPVLGRRVA
jgi:hypothetical protein